MRPSPLFPTRSFTHAFRLLRQGRLYHDAIADTLLRGGDTDTNAAIVGGLIGAATGISSIPEVMQHATLTRTTKSQGIPRPDWLQTCHAPQLVQGLLQLAQAAAGAASPRRSQEIRRGSDAGSRDGSVKDV